MPTIPRHASGRYLNRLARTARLARPTHYGSLPEPQASRGVTLIELLLAIAILGILAAALIPQISSDLPARLDAASQVVASDLDYARALAVANNSKYRLTFDPGENRYYLAHSGAQAVLNVLPPSPFRQNDDPPDRQTTELSRLPLPEPGVRVVAVVRMEAGGVSVSDVEYTPLGGTTSPRETVVWLACGKGSSARFISVHVNPVTGQVSIGPLQAELPTVVETIAEQNAESAGI